MLAQSDTTWVQVAQVGSLLEAPGRQKTKENRWFFNIFERKHNKTNTNYNVFELTLSKINEKIATINGPLAKIACVSINPIFKKHNLNFLINKGAKMLKFVFFLLASFVTSNMALADGHETAIADPAEISFVFNSYTTLQLELISYLLGLIQLLQSYQK